MFVTAVLYLALASTPVASMLNLTYVGEGACLDASGEKYGNIYINNAKDSSGNPSTGDGLLEDCSSWCGQNADQLVGVETLAPSKCICRLSNPMPTGLTIASYTPAGSGFYDGLAIGAVKSSRGNSTTQKCYSVQNPNFTPSPTSTPTKSPTKNPTNQPTRSFEGITGKSIAEPNCSIDIEGSELTCTSTIDPDDIFAGSALFMSMLQGSCEVGTEASAEQSSATSAIQVTTECKNEGSCTSEHCVRIDIKAQGVSLFAAMFTVDSTVLFDTDGAFSAEVQTAAFTSTDKTASAAVSRTLSATLGECGSSEAPAPLNVGDVAYVCISSQDDIRINLINVFANPGEQALVADGMANFVTSFENEANPVTLSTLMVPIFYDLQGGNAGSVIINGTASIIYSRRLESGRFLNDDEEGKFLIEIPLGERSVPEVVELVVEENAGPLLGLSCVAGVGIAIVLGMMF